MISEEVLNQQLKRGFRIPPKPQVLQEIDDILSSDDYSLADLSHPILKDVALSSAVLKIVNASSGGFNRAICDIGQAVCFLGSNSIKAVVSSVKLRECFGELKSVRLERFWDESVQIANIMLFINDWIGKKYPPDSLYTLGLFHDCGIPAMSLKYDDYQETLFEANDNQHIQLHELENKKYNTTHTTIGYFITSTWNFPRTLCQLIRFHHDVEFLDKNFNPEDKALVSILQMAANVQKEVKRFEYDDAYHQQLPTFLAWLEMSDSDYEDMKDDIEGIIN